MSSGLTRDEARQIATDLLEGLFILEQQIRRRIWILDGCPDISSEDDKEELEAEFTPSEFPSDQTRHPSA